MENEKVFAMSVAKVYPLLVAKAERKCRTRDEVDELASLVDSAYITTFDSFSQSLVKKYSDYVRYPIKLDEIIKNGIDEKKSIIIKDLFYTILRFS